MDGLITPNTVQDIINNIHAFCFNKRWILRFTYWSHNGLFIITIKYWKIAMKVLLKVMLIGQEQKVVKGGVPF